MNTSYMVVVAVTLCFIALTVSAVCFARKRIRVPVSQNIPRSFFWGKYAANKIYYVGGDASVAAHELIGADVNTFQVLDYLYAKDKNRIYYKHRAIEVDPTSFYVENGVPKDAHSVYFLEIDKDEKPLLRVIAGADPHTYQRMTERPGWGKDHQHYFFRHQQLNVGYESFAFISDVWAKDKERVYQLTNTGVVPVDLDVNTLSVLNEHYLRDYRQVLYAGIIPGSDDQIHQLNIVPIQADEPVALLSEYHLCYQNEIYYCGVETDIDAASFQPFLIAGRLFHGFSKDKHYVYKFNRKIKHIDVASFRLVGDILRDKHNRYDADGDIFGSPFQG